MTQEDKLRHERDEAFTALAIAQRGLSEAQRAYAAAKKNYQITLRALVEYSVCGLPELVLLHESPQVSQVASDVGLH
jgi:hypothetical protein